MSTGVQRPNERLPREIRVLVGAAFLIAIGYGIVAPAVPVFSRSFDVGVAAASGVVSAFAVMRLAFAPLGGRMLGRMGELPVFCCGLLIVGLSSAACAFAADYGQLLAFRAVGGAGSTMFTLSAASLLIKISPPEMRGRASGAWATGFLLGNIAGPIIGGALVAVSLRAPFLIYACVLFGTLVVAGFLLRGRIGAGTGPERSAAESLTFVAALRHPSFRAALTANFVNGWTVYGVRIALVPLLVVDVLRQPSSWAGLALSAFATGTAATLLIGGRLADRSGRRLPVLVGSATVAITSAWLGFTTTVTGLLAASFLSGAGTGLMSPPVNATVADVIAAKGRHSDGGRALAGFQMVGDVGAVTGPVLAGVVAETGGYPAAFAVTAVIAAVSFVSWLYAPETLPR
ncbi:MFS transporter [Pseudonocardia sp. DSM 110487]|nr:MFS transporter [Pseudonocardia sp. DSM 110487]